MWQETPRYLHPNMTFQCTLNPRTPSDGDWSNQRIKYAEQCSVECADIYIGETEQQLHKLTAQHSQHFRSRLSNSPTSQGEGTLI